MKFLSLSKRAPAKYRYFLNIFLFFAFFFIIFQIINPLEVLAQNAPAPYVKCSKTSGSEFHSLRPYPFSPCNVRIQDTVSQCGNTLVASNSITVSSCCKGRGQTCTCQYEGDYKGIVTIDFTESELPIMGNTEDVVNNEKSTDTFNDVKKMNDYVSWFLNGVINRPEYSFLDLEKPEDIKKIIDFSGPLKKLLPLRIQSDARTKEVIPKASGVRHNQIVAKEEPQTLFGKLLALLRGAKKRLSDWRGNLPPKEEDFDNYMDYYIKYMEWRGYSCASLRIPSSFLGIKIPVIGGLGITGCIDNPLKPNFWADLFPYIPFSSTEDRAGQGIAKIPNSPYSTGGAILTNLKYTDTGGPVALYFAHMKETSSGSETYPELATLLQNTYNPKNLATSEMKDITPTEVGPMCKILDTRTNPGDKLVYPQGSLTERAITGTLSYHYSFSCTFTIPDVPNPPIPTCTKSPSIPLEIFTKTPLVNDVWQKYVAGSNSVFRRIFPKLGKGSEIGYLKDIPASTRVFYSASGYSLNAESGEIYFPHIGSISEYFLKGIQTMLRPKGYGEKISFSKSLTKATTKDKVSPDDGSINPSEGGTDLSTCSSYASLDDACKTLGQVQASNQKCNYSVAASRINAPPALQAAIKNAAEFTGVPPSAIAGTLWLENRGYLFGRDGFYTNDKIQALTQKGANNPNMSKPNSCGAVGPMGISVACANESCPQAIGNWEAWCKFKGVTNAFWNDPSYNADPTNIQDALLVGAQLLKSNYDHYVARDVTGTYLPTGCDSWDAATTAKVYSYYLGSCNYTDNDLDTINGLAGNRGSANSNPCQFMENYVNSH